MDRLKILTSVLSFLIFFNSCKQDRLKIDISEIQTEVKVFRLEKKLFDKKIDYDKHLELYDQLGEFYKYYIEFLINAGPVEDSLTINSIAMFTSDKEILEVYNDIEKQFPEMNWLEIQLSDAFKHYTYYFPYKVIPLSVTYISGFNYSIATTDSALGIGLDMYLGKDYDFYKMIGFPKFKTDLMSREYIVSDAVKAWLATEFEFNPIEENLLSQMVHHGKLMYLMDAMLPEVEDSVKIGYSIIQMEWCKNNEANIWSHFIDNQVLFSTNAKEIMKYMNEGPFTPGMPRESPGKIGIWVGWQIVKAYMDRQDEIDLNKLMETDPREILKESKYKPKM